MSTNHQINCLARVPIFMQLTNEEQEQVHIYLRPARFEKGEFVAHAGDNNARLLVLNRGSAKIVRTSKDGREQIVRLLKPGDYVGELSVFTGRSSASDIVVTENSSFCTLDRKHLHDLLAAKPQLAVRLLADLSTRLERTEEYAESLGLSTASERLHALLLEIADGRGSFTLSQSKKDLASRIGVTPETLSRTLKKLESDGFIEVSNKSIRILR